MMTKKEFQEAAKSRFEAHFTNDTVVISSVTKSNGRNLTGITVKNEGSEISPIIYIDAMYEMYESNGDLDFVINKAINDMEVHMKDLPSVITNDILDLEKAMDNIYPVVINKEKSTEFLKTVPHTDFLDLAVVYKIILEDHAIDDGIGAVTIKNDILERWGITVDALHQRALQNINLRGCKIRPICEVIENSLRKSGAPEDVIELATADISDNLSMFVITNNDMVNGAGCAFLDPSILQKLSKLLNGDVILIPSSIHEAIAMPVEYCQGIQGIDAIKEMIHKVNSTEIAEEEILSENAYLYNSTTGILSVA